MTGVASVGVAVMIAPFPFALKLMVSTCILVWMLLPAAGRAVSIFEATSFAELWLVSVTSDDPLDPGDGVVFNLFGPASNADPDMGLFLDGGGSSIARSASAFSTPSLTAADAVGVSLFRVRARGTGAALTTGVAIASPTAEAFLDIDNLSASRSYLLSFEFDYALSASVAALTDRSFADAFGYLELGNSEGALFTALVQSSLPAGSATDTDADTLAFDVLLRPGDTVLLDMFAVAGGRALAVPLPPAGLLYGALLLGLAIAHRGRRAA